MAGIHDILNKLAGEEESFMSNEFLSPVVRGKPIRVRISGVVMNLAITRPKNYEGWGVFRPLSYKTARHVRAATMSERQQYLELFPTLRLVVAVRSDDGLFGLPANAADTRFRINGLIPIRLAEEVQMFETVETRFDGANCWFSRIDMGGNMKNATTLRTALSQTTEPSKMPVAGLSKAERDAYNIAYIRHLESMKDRNEERIKDAIARAGAEYRSYVERGSSYTVEYIVDGETHRSVVNKDTLGVESAGICLSGTDRNFDLRSLVGVIREGIRNRRIYRVGINEDQDEDD